MKRTEIQVLLIEDNPGDVLLLREALAQDDLTVFHLTVAENVTEAMGYLTKGTFAAALLDLELPGNQGLETFLNFHHAMPDLPVVVLSALNNEQVALQAVHAGAQDYLVKRWQEFSFAGRSLRYAIERHKSQAVLSNSEEQYRFLLNNTSDFIARFSRNGIMLFGTEASVRFNGYRPEEIVNTSAFERIHPEDQDKVRTEINRAIESGLERRVEYRVKRKSGDYIWVEATGRRVFNQAGEPEVIVVQRDITERKQVEEQLRESEEFLRLAYESTNLGIWKNDLQTGGVDFDERARIHYGLDTLHTTIAEVTNRVHPDDVARLGAEIAIATAPTGNGKFSTEYRVIHPDGSVHWLAIGVRVIFEGEGEQRHSVVGYGTSLDITERKRAEEKLRETEERLGMVLEGSQLGYWDWNIETGEVHRNARWAEMLGYTIEEIELNVRQWTDLHHPDDKESAWKSIQDHLEGKTSEHKIEYRMRAKDGQYKWILDQARIVKRDAHGKPLRMSGTHTDITERKQAEEKNASTERRYRAMIENAPDGLVLINAEGKFLYASPSVERIFGYSQADLPDCNAAEMTYPADLPMVLGELSALMQDAERVTTLQYRFRHKNGEWRWIESTFSNLLDVPDVSAIVINFRDIHDRKQADQALLKSEGHYRMLFESASDGVVLHLLSTDRVKNRFRRFNQNICRMLGYTAEEMAQLGPMDIQPPEELLHVPAEAEQMERDRELRFEKVFRRKDGTLLPTEVHSSVFELDNEMLVLSLIRDVTERKQAESQREAALKKLYESEERYRGLMESLESGVAAVDYEGKFLYMNEVAARQLGGTPQTLIGKTMHELFPETVASKQLAGVRQVFREDKGRVSESLTTLQDEVRWFRSFQQPIHDENGQVAYVLLHATDIHELKSMQQELQSRNRDMSLLLEAGRALGETLDAKQIYSQLHRYISEVMPCDMLIASSYDPQTQLLHCEFLQTSEGPQDVSEFPPIPLEPPGQGTQSQVIRTGKSLLLPDYDQAFKTATTSYIFDEHGKIVEEVPDDPERTRSAIIVPLSAEGEVVGALQIFSTELNAHTEDHLRFVEALAFRVSAALSNAKLFAELEQRVQIRTAEVQDLYNNAPAGYHSLNESGSVIMINQTLLNWLGYTREEVLGRHFAELIAPSSRGTFIQNFPILKQHGQLNNIDVEFLRKDGSTFPVLVNSTAIYDPAGNFVMSRTTVFDNTERKQAEEALRDSEDRYRKLIEFSPIAIVGFGENARFEFLNQKAIETLGGTSTEDFIGKSIFEFVHPDFQAIARERLRFSKESNAYVPAIETVYVKLNGQSVHVISSGVAMNIRGKLMNIVSFFDNTERKQAEKALHESYDRLNMVNLELEKALRVKDEFLASMSHELRTPLTGILGLSEAMQLDVYGELNDRQRRSLQSIHESGDHLLSLINDILDLSKIEAGKLEAQIAPCVLGDICQSSLQLTKGMAQQKNQYVSYSASIVPVVLNADARRVKQILVNLLSNAIKFTPEYGELGLSVEPDAANRQVRLIVWDKGIGIKPENLEKLFKPFTQIDSSLAREYSGTGLGLSLVQRLTKLNNGTVEVESVFGQGSRFIVTLPWTPKLAASDEPEPETPQLASSQPEGDSPQYTHTILIADDNLVLVNMLADFLEAHHYRAVKAESGWEVLDKLTSAKPDLVLMDIQMPGMDGLKTIQHIRNHADPAVASSRIIAVTALAMRGDRERCLAAGANEYISKPVKLKELKEMIEVQLGKR